MSLLMAMLPIYLFGNLHCIGMCGPLVMMIGQHRYRYFYFLGRTLSFTLAGVVAGYFGAVIDGFFKHYHFSEAACFLFGGILIYLGGITLSGRQALGYAWLARRMSRVNHVLSSLMLQDKAWPSFLFGFFTLSLPCGQTLIVFSACALSGDAFVGLINGLAFALLTSPSLFLAMKAHVFLRRARHAYQGIIGVSSLLIGVLALLRGFAEMDIISHWVLNPQAPSHFHIVIF